MGALWDMRQSGIVAHRPADRDEWLTLRRRAVTASQVGALLGVHDYTSALELWAEKTGWLADGQKGSEAILLRGELLEDDAIELVRRQFPSWQIEHNIIGQGGVYLEDMQHKLGATPDAFAIDSDDKRAIIEIKTTDGLTFRDKWGGKDHPEPPLWIALQAMLTAHLAGAHHAYVVVMVVGRTLDLHVVKIDLMPNLIKKLNDASLAFWERVIANQQPDPDYERDGALLAKMLPFDLGTEVDLSEDNEVVDACARRVALKADIAVAEDTLKTIDAMLRHRIGEHSTAIAGDYRISNKRIDRKGYVVQPTSYRQLIVKEKKS